MCPITFARVLHFGELFLFLSVVHLSDVDHQLLVLRWHKAGHDVVATLPDQPLKNDASLESEVAPSVLAPAQDTGDL